MIDVVVLNYNDADTVCAYVNNIKSYKSVEHIVIVDNHSTDTSLDRFYNSFRDSSKVDVISTSRNGGYGYGNNEGVRYLLSKYNSEFVLISNPDVIYNEGTIINCREFLEKNSQFAVVAPRMKNLIGEYVNCAWNIPSWIVLASGHTFLLEKRFPMKYLALDESTEEYIQADCVAGSMLMIRSDYFKNIGMYDEKIFLYHEETSLGIRMKEAGYKSAILINESFIHAHSVSINRTINSRIGKEKIMLTSAMHILQDNYNLSIVKKVMINTICVVNRCEFVLRELKGKLKRK